MTRTLGHSRLCELYPEAFELGRFRMQIRLERLKAKIGIVTSAVIQDIIHGETDYAWLDGQLHRGHTYEEGIAFVQGFYDTRDSAFDFSLERES